MLWCVIAQTLPHVCDSMAGNKNRQLSAALWRRIQPLLPRTRPSPQGGRPRVDDERVLNGILFVLRTGIPWNELPQELGFGSGMTCWRRLRGWRASGVWNKVHRLLQAELRDAKRLDFSRARPRAGPAPRPRNPRTKAASMLRRASGSAMR